MGLAGTIVRQVEIKSDGDAFYELFKCNPRHISTLSPANIQRVDLCEGDWGSVGSVINWIYFHDWEEKVSTEVMEAADERKRSVTFKVIEGELVEQFKTFKFIMHVDANCEKSLVTWTFEYEKLSEDVHVPETLLDFCMAITKDIETHHLK